jgi:phenylpropionate dioxygenase-like ring-hydroxylating dioxygenase large terminal subunit
MDRALELSLIERVHALLDGRTFHMVEKSATTPARRYFDPAELERERVLFSRLPIALAHASELARDGQFLTHDDSGAPLLLTRSDGKLRGFLNVCRHRGTRIESAPCGEKRAFVCPYHGWSYQLGGQLLHIPHEEGFCDVDRKTLDLTPISVEECAGFLWATTTLGEPCDAKSHLGPVAAELDGIDLARHVVYRPTRFRKQLNWKIAVEIFFEAYHVKRTHEKSIYPVFIDNVALFDAHPPHLRNFFPKRTITSLRTVEKSDWKLREHGNLLYFIFPNTMILVQPDHAGVFHLFPRGTDETEILAYTLIPEPATSDGARRHWDKNIEILYGATAEDLAMGESIQRGVRSGANRDFRFGRYEQSLALFRDEVERAIVKLS